MSQFGYYSFVWKKYSRTLISRINGLLKRAVSLIDRDFSPRFSEPLEKENSVATRHRNLQTLAYEIFFKK